MRREQHDESDPVSSNDDLPARRGEPGGGQAPGVEGAPATGAGGSDRRTSPPEARALPADEWEDQPESERLGRDLDIENR